MPTKSFVNLPVKNLNRSVDFFTSLGFSFNAQFTDETATCMIVSEDIFVMLLTHEKFKTFTPKPEEAMHFYVSIFKHSKVGRVTRDGEAGPGPKGSVMSATFELDGQEFFALNGGPHFTFSPAISFFVNCETPEEVDEFWEKLSAGGEKQRCGWLKDSYGVTWQIVPSVLDKLLQDKDAEKSTRVTKAMMQMDKLEIRGLEQAALG